jgi:hypothetical protein
MNNPLIYTDPSGNFSWPWEWDWSWIFSGKKEPQPPPEQPQEPKVNTPDKLPSPEDDAIIANPLLDPIEIGVIVITGGTTTGGKAAGKGLWSAFKSLFTKDVADGSLRQIVRSLGAAGDDLLLKKAVNSNLPHAIERGVERGVFKTAQEASEALRGLTVEISKTGTFPAGTLVDTARAGRFLVPVGDNGMAVYQLAKNGTAKLKTVLTAR